MSPPTERASIEEALQQSLIVIPSINGGPLLDRMLPTLRVPGRMVVVLDQGSTDNTAEVCGRHGVEIVQLGEPKTYTEACNLGIELAKARGCEFIFFSNNDIVFTTDVARELLGELIEDENLGIVAPSQVLVSSANGTQRVSYRSFWDLQRLKFAHDYTAPPLPTKRLESDFCE
jgi:GT2 family glycosyltransferase